MMEFLAWVAGILLVCVIIQATSEARSWYHFVQLLFTGIMITIAMIAFEVVANLAINWIFK